MKKAVFSLIALLLVAAGPKPVSEDDVRSAIAPLDQCSFECVQKLKELGPELLPHLVHVYSKSSDEDRAIIARILYTIGWKSPEAREALLKDIRTQNENLRIHVQWALGRVSDDTEIVDILATIMMNDPNAFFRDKAACALAYDQIHLTEKQKVRLYSKLIQGLSDEKQQVRAISLQALNIHTGQTKGFDPNAAPGDRANAVARWKIWLVEYEKNL
jgi:HEAT repeat protein